MSDQYIIELRVPGEEGVVIGPYRTLEKVLSLCQWLVLQADSADVDIEMRVVALEKSHSSATALFRRVHEVAGMTTS